MPEDYGKLKLILQELVRRSNAQLSRLREIEQRLRSNETKLSSMEEMILTIKKQNTEQFDETKTAINEIKEKILKLENDVMHMKREKERFALKKEVKELMHMLDLISPISQEFVTKDELEEELETALKRNFINKKEKFNLRR